MPRIRLFHVRLFSLAAVFGLLLVGVAAPAQGAALAQVSAPPGKNIAFCHATSSASNPYVQLASDPASILKQGHDSHPEDIIPPFEGYEGSARWQDPNYRAILDNGCKQPPCPPSPTPTPTPTTTSPTPEPTPTPTPTTTSPEPTPTPTPDPSTGTPTDTSTPTPGASFPSCVCPSAGQGNADPGAGAASTVPSSSAADPARPCSTQTALAYTGTEGASSSAGVMVLGLSALIAGAAVLALTMRPRGHHN